MLCLVTIQIQRLLVDIKMAKRIYISVVFPLKPTSDKEGFVYHRRSF